MNVVWKSKALRQLEKIKDKKVKVDIVTTVDTLTEFPNCKNVKALVNHAYDYRLRVGKFRIFFTVHGKIEIIEIEEVRKRDEHTY